jgi:hypothetical protein
MNPSPVAALARTLEVPVITVAIFLAPILPLKHSTIFFTLSDLLFCLALVIMVLAGRVPRAPLGRATSVWLLSCATLLSGIVVSSLLGPAPVRSLIVCGQYAFAYVLLMFLIAGRDEATTHFLAKTFVISIVLSQIVGFTMFFLDFDFGLSIVNPSFTIVTGNERLASLIGDANGNAAIIAFTFPFLLYLWLSGRMTGWVVLPAALILGTAVVLTSSNSGLAATLLGLVCFLATAGSYGLRATRIIMAALAVAIAVWGSFGFTLPYTFEKRVLGAVESGDLEEAGTFRSRMNLMVEAVDIVDDAMLFGVGADQFREMSVQKAPVHNMYLLLWAEGGLIALVGWLSLMTLPLVGVVFLSATAHPRARLLRGFALTVVIVFCGAAFNSPHMYGRYWAVPFVLVVGLVFRPTWQGVADPAWLGAAGAEQRRGS